MITPSEYQKKKRIWSTGKSLSGRDLTPLQYRQIAEQVQEYERAHPMPGSSAIPGEVPPIEEQLGPRAEEEFVGPTEEPEDPADLAAWMRKRDQPAPSAPAYQAKVTQELPSSWAPKGQKAEVFSYNTYIFTEPELPVFHQYLAGLGYENPEAYGKDTPEYQDLSNMLYQRQLEEAQKGQYPILRAKDVKGGGKRAALYLKDVGRGALGAGIETATLGFAEPEYELQQSMERHPLVSEAAGIGTTFLPGSGPSLLFRGGLGAAKDVAVAGGKAARAVQRGAIRTAGELGAAGAPRLARSAEAVGRGARQVQKAIPAVGRYAATPAGSFLASAPLGFGFGATTQGIQNVAAGEPLTQGVIESGFGAVPASLAFGAVGAGSMKHTASLRRNPKGLPMLERAGGGTSVWRPGGMRLGEELSQLKIQAERAGTTPQLQLATEYAPTLYQKGLLEPEAATAAKGRAFIEARGATEEGKVRIPAWEPAFTAQREHERMLTPEGEVLPGQAKDAATLRTLLNPQGVGTEYPTAGLQSGKLIYDVPPAAMMPSDIALYEAYAKATPAERGRMLVQPGGTRLAEMIGQHPPSREQAGTTGVEAEQARTANEFLERQARVQPSLANDVALYKEVSAKTPQEATDWAARASMDELASYRRGHDELLFEKTTPRATAVWGKAEHEGAEPRADRLLFEKVSALPPEGQAQWRANASELDLASFERGAAERPGEGKPWKLYYTTEEARRAGLEPGKRLEEFTEGMKEKPTPEETWPTEQTAVSEGLTGREVRKLRTQVVRSINEEQKFPRGQGVREADIPKTMMRKVHEGPPPPTPEQEVLANPPQFYEQTIPLWDFPRIHRFAKDVHRLTQSAENPGVRPPAWASALEAVPRQMYRRLPTSPVDEGPPVTRTLPSGEKQTVSGLEGHIERMYQDRVKMERRAEAMNMDPFSESRQRIEGLGLKDVENLRNSMKNYPTEDPLFDRAIEQAAAEAGLTAELNRIGALNAAERLAQKTQRQPAGYFNVLKAAEGKMPLTYYQRPTMAGARMRLDPLLSRLGVPLHQGGLKYGAGGLGLSDETLRVKKWLEE